MFSINTEQGKGLLMHRDLYRKIKKKKKEFTLIPLLGWPKKEKVQKGINTTVKRTGREAYP